jgi:murein DD-endopeptidase MepM/ murein hydrolase activator NlpD
MSRVQRFVPALCATIVLLAAAAAGAGAQEDPGTSSTTSSTVVDPATSTTGATTTLVDPSTSTSTSTTQAPPPPTTAPIVDPAAGGDSPTEVVPVVDVTVPPRTDEAALTGPYAGQVPYAMAPGRIVQVSVRSARTAALAAQAAYDTAVALRTSLEAKAAQLERTVARLGAASRRAIRELEAATVFLRERAANAYVRGSSSSDVSLFLESENPQEYARRKTLLGTVLDADEDVVDRYARARRAVDGQGARTAAELATVKAQLDEARVVESQTQFAAEAAQFELRVFSEGGSIAIHGFVFPVGEPFNFSDSFGAPRMLGSEFEHWHEGTDIFAPAGTPLYASERGVITKMGTDVLGGIKLWLKGESGTYYYYAHLQGFAPGIVEGTVVEAGTVVGYVGNTGNAATTPAHLHFEVHPAGGMAINPYPLLKVAAEQTRATA